MSSVSFTVIASLVLPALLASCATENTDRCLGDAIFAEGITVQSASVPMDCHPPGSRSNEVPTP